MFAIFEKEMRAYFTSASGYIFMGVFLLITGIYFAMGNLMQASPYFTAVLESVTFIFLILVPVITMRILSEESRQKTDQLLLTSPISTEAIVVGKFLAAIGLFLLTIAVTFFFPMILSMFGTLAGGEIVTSYIGFLLLGACFISVGLFVSSLTDNQVVAAVGTFGALLFIWIIDWLKQGLPATKVSGLIFVIILTVLAATIIYYATKNIFVSIIIAAIGIAASVVVYIIKSTLFEGLIAKFFDWFSLLSRYQNFSAGILDVSSIVYYITFSTAFIFLTIRMLEKKRWS